MEAPPDQPGFKRTETGLWIPDIKGLDALKIEEEGVALDDMMDPAEWAKSNCKFCHGKGEMRRSAHPGSKLSKVIWTLCMCVIKRFPQGKANTEKLMKTERVKVRHKKQ